MAVGTGLGAGVVIDGEPLRYLGGCAGDTGHVIIKPGGPSCSMGCRGCAEALCGVAGIEQLAKERTGQATPAHEIISRAREGEPEAAAIMEQIGQWLGLTLASLCSIYLPERVALTGGVSSPVPCCSKHASGASVSWLESTMNAPSRWPDSFTEASSLCRARCAVRPAS